MKFFLGRKKSKAASKRQDIGHNDPLTNTDPTSSEPTPPKLFPNGIKVWVPCPDAVIDICFVHGLTGDREATWTADGQPQPWPQALLPSRLKRARILTFGYDAYIVRKGVASSNRLIDHATNLMADLASDREKCNATSRPLIFVAHSLGGLVCKKALQLSHNTADAHHRDIFESFKGVVFMGTPHKGAWIASWAKIPASAFGFVKSTQTSLLGALQSSNQLLESIQIDFLNLVRRKREEGPGPEISCFFEEYPIIGIGMIVSKDSAVLEGYEQGSIATNHRNMVKFATEEDNGFERVLRHLSRWEKQASEDA